MQKHHEITKKIIYGATNLDHQFHNRIIIANLGNVMKNKDIHKLLAGSIAFVLVFGITIPAYAGNGLPPINMAQVQDNGNIVDLEIWASTPIPDPAFSPSGYGVITNPTTTANVLLITTSHAGVCDSATQTPGVCEGDWHNHHAILGPDDICNPVQGLRVVSLSFESPGVVTPPGGTQHISFWNAPRSELATDAISGTPNFQFGTIDPVQPSYPAAIFDIAVFGGLDANGFPNFVQGLRQVCVFNVATTTAPNDPKVGGEFLGVESAALLIAGFQASAIWMIPTIAGIAATGIYLTKFRANKED